MKEDLDRMLWEGDEIYFRIGTGLAPDFRERATGTRQELAENGLPLVTTSWHNQGIDYEEQAYATLLEAPLDDAHLRGDEPSVLFLRLGATNPGPSPVQAQLWFHVSPPQDLQLKDGMLFGTGGRPSDYGQRPLRAGFEAADGVLQIRAAPHTGFSDNYLANSIEERVTSVNGQAVLWSVAVPAHQTKVLDIKVPFRAVFSATEQDHFKRIRFESRLDETLMYWKRRIGTAGMQIRLPDEMLNSFYVAVLQHVLVSEERDVGTGYTMCPCGTYDYNMFANETDIQVRLLDMRGLHADAWRCLRPLVELQGSKPLPGRFRNTSAEFHGVRIDANHDYTHSGYNLNHGWTLWTLAEHYLFSRDDQWLHSVLPRILRAAAWIVDERKGTMRHGLDGARVPEYGLLPAGELEDNEDWAYWFAVNAYAYRGLSAAAQAVSALDSVQG